MAKILVVDDDPYVGEIVCALMCPMGHAVESVLSGEAGLDAMKRDPPDLVVLDIMMPGMDGYTVFTEMERHDATRGIPVIVLTAKGGTSDIFTPSPQVRAFIEKPFDSPRLKEAMDAALSVRA